MKPIGESPEVMAAYAEIDLCHLAIKKLYKDEYVSSTIPDTISFFERLIEAKKIIEADYTNDEKTLNELKKFNH